MNTREDLQALLEQLLDSREVYYQAPSTIRMEYPAIRYSKGVPDIKHAGDIKYSRKNRYDVIVISKTVDHPVIDKLLELPYCSMGRTYIADNLYHTPLTLYY